MKFFYVQFNIRAHFPMFCGGYSAASVAFQCDILENCIGVALHCPILVPVQAGEFPLSVIPVSVFKCLMAFPVKIDRGQRY